MTKTEKAWGIFYIGKKDTHGIVEEYNNEKLSIFYDEKQAKKYFHYHVGQFLKGGKSRNYEIRPVTITYEVKE